MDVYNLVGKAAQRKISEIIHPYIEWENWLL
jgi:hypothetical protein